MIIKNLQVFVKMFLNYLSHSFLVIFGFYSIFIMIKNMKTNVQSRIVTFLRVVMTTLCLSSVSPSRRRTDECVLSFCRGSSRRSSCRGFQPARSPVPSPGATAARQQPPFSLERDTERPSRPTSQPLGPEGQDPRTDLRTDPRDRPEDRTPRDRPEGQT